MRPSAAVVVGLRRAHLALDDRVDELEMARVRGQRHRRPRRSASREAASAPWWYLTSPEPPRGRSPPPRAPARPRTPQDRVVLAADRVCEHVQPAAVGHADARRRWRRSRRRARSPRRASAPSRRGPRSRTASGPGTRGAGSARSPRPRRGAAGAPSARRRRAGAGTCRTRSRRAARAAARGSRCARSRTRSSRSRSRAASAAPRPASRPRRRGGGSAPGSAPGARRSAAARGGRGRAAGSPGGSEPSGSRCAARWPCVRCAFTSDMAAATPPTIRSSAGGASRRRGRGRRSGAVAVSVGAKLPQPYAVGQARENELRVGLEELPPLRVDGLGRGEVVGQQLLDEAAVEIVYLVGFHSAL